MNLAAVNRFANIAARDRRALSTCEIQPYTGTGAATADGSPLCVFQTATRVERELVDSGFITKHVAQLRVLKTARWTPVEGLEYVRTDTSERFRINSAVGSDSAFAAEIVCEVVRISA